DSLPRIDLDLTSAFAAIAQEAAYPLPVVPAAAARRCLIWSHEHGAWWRPNRLGYTPVAALAGRYTEAEAREICENAAYGWLDGRPPEVMVLADCPDLVEA